MKRTKGLGLFYIILAIFLIIVFAILLYPNIVMLISSFQDTGTGAFTLDNYKEIFTSSIYTDGFRNSILLSVYSSIVGLLATVLATYAVHSYLPRLKKLFLILANLTANYVGVPLSFGLIILFGNAGIITVIDQVAGWNMLSDFSIYSISGLMIAFVYFQLPLGITLLIPIYDALDNKWREAASLLGASRLQFWWKIGLPILMPSFVGVFFMMFANGIGTYDTAVALTGTGVNLISIRIANTISGDIFALPEVGAALSVVLALVLLVSMILGQWLSNRNRRIAG